MNDVSPARITEAGLLARKGPDNGAVDRLPARTAAARGRGNDGNDSARLEHGDEAASHSAAYDALPPGGAFMVIENMIDDARRENAFGLLMSLNMLIEFGDAFDFTGSDFSAWCRDAGFSRTEIIPLGGPASAGVAYK